jgi:hypothetical protein
LSLFGLLAACASTSPTLSRVERERLPLDGRQEIFDAENDVIIARNRADMAQERLRAVEESLASWATGWTEARSGCREMPRPRAALLCCAR